MIAVFPHSTADTYAATTHQELPDRAKEAVLLQHLRRGDESAFAALVRQQARRMLAVARKYLDCEEDCADAVQDAFLAAFRALPTFAGNAKLATWLHRIVVNVCLMKRRARPRNEQAALDVFPAFDAATKADAPLEREEIRAQVRACIERLPDTYRTILVLRDLEELDTEQTAQQLGLAPGAVKTRLHRARQALRTLLQPLVLGERCA